MCLEMQDRSEHGLPLQKISNRPEVVSQKVFSTFLGDWCGEGAILISDSVDVNAKNVFTLL